MLKHLGSSLASAIGTLAVLGGFASAYRGHGTGAGDLIISAPIIILGALAYRSAKKRMLGQVAATTTRKVMEGVAVLLIVALLFSTNDLKTLIALEPAHYIIIPAWAIIAYMFVGFRSPKGD